MTFYPVRPPIFPASPLYAVQVRRAHCVLFLVLDGTTPSAADSNFFFLVRRWAEVLLDWLFLQWKTQSGSFLCRWTLQRIHGSGQMPASCNKLSIEHALNATCTNNLKRPFLNSAHHEGGAFDLPTCTINYLNLSVEHALSATFALCCINGLSTPPLMPSYHLRHSFHALTITYCEIRE